MRFKKIGIFLVLLFSMVLTLSEAYCLGINPGVYDIEYSKGRQNFKFNVLNRNGYTTLNEVEILSNDFGSNLNFDTDSFKLPPDSMGAIQGSVLIDESLEPGENCARFRITEGINSRTSMIEARPALIARACVFVPYPGKYVEPKISQDSAVDNSKVYFSAKLENKGDQPIANCKISVKIYDASGALIEEIPSNQTISLNPLETKTIFFRTSQALKGGEYKGQLLINYDGEKKEEEFPLRVGIRDIEFAEVPSTLYFKDDVITFTAKLKSLWNDRIYNAYLELSIPELSSKSITSSVFTIGGWEEKEVEGIGRIQGLSEGSYDAEFIAHFGNQTASIEKKIELKEEVAEAKKEEAREIKAVSLKSDNSIPPLAVGMFLFSTVVLVYVVISLSKKRDLNSSDL
jgi:hypothetical protein